MTPLHLAIVSENRGNVRVILFYVNKLDDKPKKSIFLAKDDREHTPFLLPAYLNFTQKTVKRMMKDIYKAAPLLIQQPMLFEKDLNKNNIFHLMVKNKINYCDKLLIPTNHIFHICEGVFGKLLNHIRLDMDGYTLLANERNKSGATPLDCLAKANDMVNEQMNLDS